MPEKRFPRDGKQRRKPQRASKQSEPRFARDPLFGNIPLIRHSNIGLNGKSYEWWQYDLEFQPPLPQGAVRGDVRKQNYCPAHHTPKYFYVDEDRQCIQCGRDFIFQAQEQKYWYETLKFNFSSIPIRCLHCRRERRSEHAIKDCMSPDAISVSEEAKLDECVHLMEKHRIRRILVLDSFGHCCGIVSQADIARYADKKKTGEVVHQVSQPSA